MKQGGLDFSSRKVFPNFSRQWEFSRHFNPSVPDYCMTELRWVFPTWYSLPKLVQGTALL